jgi:hypothetical protein
MVLLCTPPLYTACCVFICNLCSSPLFKIRICEVFSLDACFLRLVSVSVKIIVYLCHSMYICLVHVGMLCIPTLVFVHACMNCLQKKFFVSPLPLIFHHLILSCTSTWHFPLTISPEVSSSLGPLPPYRNGRSSALYAGQDLPW